MIYCNHDDVFQRIIIIIFFHSKRDYEHKSDELKSKKNFQKIKSCTSDVQEKLRVLVRVKYCFFTCVFFSFVRRNLDYISRLIQNMRDRFSDLEIDMIEIIR